VNVADRPAPASGSRVAWWRVLSWQMYDFADTIYSMNVYTLYFGLFLAAVYHKDSADFGWALTLPTSWWRLSHPSSVPCAT
jgi:MFS-type transporter involved in bile tolerance (Atg22 family)